MVMDRRTIIIKEALSLFATKGYQATSIQEIADRCGIAKGTFYNYFNSKDDLLVSSIKFYSIEFAEKMDAIAKNADITPKQVFYQQLLFQLEKIVENRSFVEIHIKEQVFLVNDEIKDLVFKMRAARLNYLISSFESIYGDEIEPYKYDLATIVNGMIGEYIRYIVIDGKKFNLRKLVSFFINQIDDLVAGFMKHGNYYLTSSDLKEFIEVNNQLRERLNVQLKEVIQAVYKQLEHLGGDLKVIEKVKTSMEVFEDEFFNKEQPKMIVLEGLLLFLRTLDLPNFDTYWNEIDGIIKKLTETY